MIVNKLLVDKEKVYKLKDTVVEIFLETENITLEIEGCVCINDVSFNDLENRSLTILLKKGSELVYNKFSSIKKMNQRICIEVEENSKVTFNHSILTQEDSSLVFISNILGNRNDCQIHIKAVTEGKGKMKVEATGSVKAKTKENNLLENVRILTLNEEENEILPNLLVDSNEVNVNHNATISSIDEEELFYLTSKGISKEKVILLLKKGFLIHFLQIEEEIKEKIENLL